MDPCCDLRHRIFSSKWIFEMTDVGSDVDVMKIGRESSRSIARKLRALAPVPCLAHRKVSAPELALVVSSFLSASEKKIVI